MPTRLSFNDSARGGCLSMLVDARPSIEKHRNCGKMGVIGLCVALTNRVRDFLFFLISLFPEK